MVVYRELVAAVPVEKLWTWDKLPAFHFLAWEVVGLDERINLLEHDLPVLADDVREAEGTLAYPVVREYLAKRRAQLEELERAYDAALIKAAMFASEFLEVDMPPNVMRGQPALVEALRMRVDETEEQAKGMKID